MIRAYTDIKPSSFFWDAPSIGSPGLRPGAVLTDKRRQSKREIPLLVVREPSSHLLHLIRVDRRASPGLCPKGWSCALILRLAPLSRQPLETTWTAVFDPGRALVDTAGLSFFPAKIR